MKATVKKKNKKFKIFVPNQSYPGWKQAANMEEIDCQRQYQIRSITFRLAGSKGMA